MTFELTEREEAERRRARWFSDRGREVPLTSVAVLLDALDRALGEDDEVDGGAP